MLYGFKYFYLIQINYILSYGLKYSNLIQISYTLLYGLKYKEHTIVSRHFCMGTFIDSTHMKL